MTSIRYRFAGALAVLGAVALLVAVCDARGPRNPSVNAGTGGRALDRLVTSYPGPGWEFASSKTTISFRGAGVAALEGLEVTGSASGVHAGRLHPHRLGTGAVFTPDRRFRAGERVTVRAPVRVRGAEDGTYSFRTAHLKPHGGVPPSGSPPSRMSAVPFRPANWPRCRVRRRTYRTLPSIRRVPMCTIGRGTRLLAPGKLLITSRPGESPRGQWAAMILSRSGRLLWYRIGASRVNDLKVVNSQGRGLLALFRYSSHPSPYHELLDASYRSVMRVRAGNGYRSDAHEFQLTDQGTAFLGAYKAVWTQANRKVTDYIVQEVDVVTGDVLFEWHALDHVPRSASYRFRRAADVAYDFFHGNSIEPPSRHGRTILVSARNTSAVYGIDSVTGAVRWILGGEQDQFGIRERHPGWQFCAQHDARRLPNGDITIFDNGSTYSHSSRECPPHRARFLQFRLDTQDKTVRLVRKVSSRRISESGQGYFPYAVGSARRQPNGNVLISWGTAGRITEVTGRGRPLFRLALGEAGGELGNWTYRAVRAPWTGRPTGRPLIAARRRGRRAVDLWASWNGATEIRRWRVLTGDTPERLRRTRPAFSFAGLETEMRIRTNGAYVAVQALSRTGAVLGESEPARVD